MRPQCFHCGKAVARAAYPWMGDASMRPQCFHCGKGAAVIYDLLYIMKASMRPQCFHCGKGATSAEVKAKLPLQ